jgi:phosphatidylglycerophosphatase C
MRFTLWTAQERGCVQSIMRAMDNSADLPLLRAAKQPVVVNPKPQRVAMFRRVLPPGTQILNWAARGGDVV